MGGMGMGGMGMGMGMGYGMDDGYGDGYGMGYGRRRPDPIEPGQMGGALGKMMKSGMDKNSMYSQYEEFQRQGRRPYRPRERDWGGGWGGGYSRSRGGGGGYGGG